MTRKLGIVLTLIGIGLCIHVVTGASFWDQFLHPRIGHGPRFLGDRLYNVDIGLNNVNGHIAAFGDFDSDKYTDVFIVDKSKSVISIHLWNTDEWKFNFLSNITIEGIIIENAAALDFNYDGKLDLFVQGKSHTNLTQNILRLYSGNYEKLEFFVELPYSDSQVIITEANMDLLPDFLGMRNGKRTFWVNSKESPGNYVLEEMEINTDIPFLETHSNAFADVNGDCLADLMLTTLVDGKLNLEILVNIEGKWEYHSSTEIDIPGAGRITFSDFDGDGNIDMLIPVCLPKGSCEDVNQVQIIYNQQTKVCNGLFDKNCRKSQSLCTADDNFIFPSFDPENVVILDGSSFPEDTQLFELDDFPLTIRSGDYNLDSYPDLLIPMKVGDNPPKIQLFENIGCTLDLCSEEATKMSRRTFKQMKSGVASLLSIEDAYAGAFFDIDEDGTNDILVMNSNQSQLSIHGVFNNYWIDAYSLKTLGLNGVCTQWCTDGQSFPDPKPYGVNQYGATIKYVFTDLKGNAHMTHIPQLSQSSFLSLQTPYKLSGLGRPSNYVEYLFLGVPLNGKDVINTQSWPGIIPNSQVVAIPYPQDSVADWSLELYLSPSGYILWIMIACVAWTLMIGCAILFFSRREKKQDEKERKAMEHLFSFKAF
eukprot:TRINITY_DN8271_c0_g2_i1.p1 TRINITY_DN8271_c0_g2~~TRINITY_DN8271_c0_g2_i1.p1  ORF type:complete len:658 (+),score=140.74 TRINITY_DN8271_c0_g2_i1:28-1974(+)